MTVNESNIPEELKSHRAWVVWKLEQVEPLPKKPTKVPYSPVTRRMASSVDKFSWGSFDDAIALYRSGGFDGIGFVLSKDDPYVVIDLDKPETAEDTAENNRIFFAMNSYTEYSPSGTGVHIWTKAEIGKGRNKRPVEMYGQMRFMTVTGNTCYNAPIEYRQAEVTELWELLKPKTEDAFIQHDGTAPESMDDQALLNKAASARNGYKFTQLWHGHYDEWYSSQSEADFALIDILAFYTQNTAQIARLFRHSALGQREKAMRDDYLLPTIQKAYDRLTPYINIDALSQQAAEIIAAASVNQTETYVMPTEQVTPIVVASPVEIEQPTSSVMQPTYAAELNDGNIDAPYTFPRGLVGEIADYIYRSSPRPVKEVALSAAIGLMAGITGNSYNISNLGLNVYILVLAPTGVGKESMHTGMSKLMQAIKPLVPSSEGFIGASEIASPQALLNNLAKKQRCFVSVIGECGMWLRNLSDANAPAHFSGLRRILLALYGRSGQGSTVQPSIYADSAKNTDTIVSPSVSLLGESTQNRFFDAIDEDLIAEGFVPRWTIIEYTGERPQLNKAHATVYPSNELIGGLANLATYCTQQMASLQATSVAATREAEIAMDAFDKFCDAQINNTAEDGIRDLWTRAHVKAMKLAALVAVGRNIGMPTIDEEDFAWARHIVLKDVMRMCRRFNSGQLAARVQQNDTGQQEKIIEAIVAYLKDPKTVGDRYGVKEVMQASRVIPLYYFQRKLSGTKVFKNDRRGAVNAIQYTLKNMANAGLVTEIPEAQGFVNYQFSGKMYVVADAELLLKRS